MPKSFFTEYRLELSCLLTLLFGFLTLIGIIGWKYIEMGEDDNSVTFKLPSGLAFFEDFLNPLGTWVTWLAVGAPIALIICVWWLYDYVKKVRELAELVDTPSKAKFVRNLDDIEYLAWSLPRKFEEKVIAKKKEFKL